MPQMTELSDRIEILDLVARLGHWLDAGDYTDGSALYTEDAVVLSPRGTAEGLDAIQAHLRRSTPDGEHSQHLTTDVVVELDGDRAEIATNQLVSFYRDGEEPHRLVGLRHRYAAGRGPHGWRLRRAEITPLWFRTA
jgi:ketosteroid isomerase-like protein